MIFILKRNNQVIRVYENPVSVSYKCTNGNSYYLQFFYNNTFTEYYVSSKDNKSARDRVFDILTNIGSAYIHRKRIITIDMD